MQVCPREGASYREHVHRRADRGRLVPHSAAGGGSASARCLRKTTWPVLCLGLLLDAETVPGADASVRVRAAGESMFGVLQIGAEKLPTITKAGRVLRNVNDIFKSTTQSLWETMESHGGKVGFRVPEYQRTYDWDQANLKRLLEDAFNGFYYLSQHNNQESYTFLGTIILVNDKSSESSFEGTSLEIVDGQQRLTTLSLLCCALLQQLIATPTNIDVLDKTTRDWLLKEKAFLTNELAQCASGYLRHGGTSTAFPRIVRARDDNRANTSRYSEYRSGIARFLRDFSQYAEDYDTDLRPQFEPPSDADNDVVAKFKYLKSQVETYIYPKDDNNDAIETRPDDGIDCEVVRRPDFEKQGLRSLFQKLNSLPDKSAENRAMTSIAQTNETEGFIRLLLFSWYLLKCVVLTRVETDDEKYAFDIFDALNTTGQPLTALETLKPFVIRWEGQKGNYAGSLSEEHFHRLDRDVSALFHETEERQKETKHLLVSHALYYAGKKLSSDLGAQRTFLRSEFEAACKKSHDNANAAEFIEGIADLAEFRRHYWKTDGIRGLNTIHTSSAKSEPLQLCMGCISDMNTSLAIPVLARYWVRYKTEGDEEGFVGAAKSVAAFLAIRRAVTGGTGGIDSDFRATMLKLCIQPEKALLSNRELNEQLRSCLRVTRIGVMDKESWVARARETSLGTSSNHLCRFLLFAAADNAKPDANNRGLLTREGVIPSGELEFFNFRTWQQEQYGTVEHVAPDSNPGGGWDPRIYERPTTRQTIGNLVLLPQKENSSAGNAPWLKKKLFYAALRAETTGERERRISQAEEEGFEFAARTKTLLNESDRLRMLDPLIDVEEWTEAFIQERSQNILELAWDKISPWLYE